MNKRIKKKKKRGYAKVACTLIFGGRPNKNLTLIRSGTLFESLIRNDMLFEAVEKSQAELIEKLKYNTYMEGPREDN